MGTAGNDGRGPHYFGEGETAEAVPRKPHVAWTCPSCGQQQIGNVDQGCQNQDCTVWKLTHEPAAAPKLDDLHKPALESVTSTAPPPMLREVYEVVEQAGLWVQGKWTNAHGVEFDRTQARIQLGLEQPAALEDELLPVYTVTLMYGPAEDHDAYERELSTEETRTIVVALQTFAENVLVAGTPEGLISQAAAETLAKALQP